MSDIAPAGAPPGDETVAAVRRLVELLQLERIEHNLFRGANDDIGSLSVFGGQVLGQALMAAGRTVAGHDVHSLHGYFLRAGDKAAPIIYEVDRIRDGASFTTRRVVAIQHGEAIFHMSASFHRREAGADHQSPMPDAAGPDGLPDDGELKRRMLERVPERMHAFLQGARAIDFRPVDPLDPFDPPPAAPRSRQWLRSAAPLPDDPLLHHALLAYASDFSLLSVAMRPHAMSFLQPQVQSVSLDHAIWFHRDFRFDDWLLYDADSPSAAHARGFCRGMLFQRDGTLVASVAQEGLIRRRTR